MYICSMSLIFENYKILLLIGFVSLLLIMIPIGRWLYLRSVRLRNRLHMSYLLGGQLQGQHPTVCTRQLHHIAERPDKVISTTKNE